jgi:hypothetical protein
MSKSIDLGKRLNDSAISVKMLDPSEPHYPDLYISDSEDPKLADIPDKGECTIKYRVVSRQHHEDNRDGKKKHTCSIRMEILSMTPPEKAKRNGNGYGDDARKSLNDYFKDK